MLQLFLTLQMFVRSLLFFDWGLVCCTFLLGVFTWQTAAGYIILVKELQMELDNQAVPKNENASSS